MGYFAKILAQGPSDFFLPKQEAGCGECRGSRDLKLSKSTAFMMHVSDGRERRKTYAEVFIGILGKIGGTISLL